MKNPRSNCWPASRGFFKVIWLGLEPKTYCLEGSCSIQLSYQTPLVFRTYIASKKWGAPENSGAKVGIFLLSAKFFRL